MSEPTIATLFDTLEQISLASKQLYEGLATYQSNYNSGSPSTDSNLSKVLNEFAGALLLYVQYISSFSEALSALDKKARRLAKYLKKNPFSSVLSLEQMLTLPQNQIGVYHFTFSKLRALDTGQRAPLDSVLESIEKVYLAIHKQETELELLRIQACFIGNPPIFKTDRILISEGDLFRVTEDNRDKQYRFHLFSDALIYR